MDTMARGEQPQKHSLDSDIDAFIVKNKPKSPKLKYKDIVEIGMSWK